MALQKTIKKWIKDQITYHKTDMSSVIPEHRFSMAENAIYLNSCAGLIKFTSRDVVEMETFRNIFVNRFEGIKENKNFFRLYSEIMKEKWSSKSRLRYRANARTMVRMKIEG